MINRRLATIIGAIFAISVCCCPVTAIDSVSNVGEWPKDWPGDLESLRQQSQTLIVGKASFREYIIPFKKREAFEAAWPHIVKIKTKGAPIILINPPKNGEYRANPAGVSIHSPPEHTSFPESPINSDNIAERWQYTTFIYLVVDGEIVDLNRIPIPLDTPIVDERFNRGIPASEIKAALVGEWVAEKVLSSGEEVPAEKFPFELHFTESQLIYKFVGRIQGKDRVHDIQLDASQNPPTIDITRTVGDKKITVLAIFKLNDDQLSVCFTRTSDGNPSETRPTSFESTKDTGSDLMILRRKSRLDR